MSDLTVVGKRCLSLSKHIFFIGKLNVYYANSVNTYFDQNFWFNNNKWIGFK